jgi:hypothetical protein
VTEGVRARVLVGMLLLAAALAGSYLLERRAGPPADAPPGLAERESLPEPLDIPFAEQQRRVRVEVLNGAGETGAAATATDSLRAWGFDVKTYGNAPRFDVEETFVIDRSGREGAASRLAERLGRAELRVDLDPELYLDATVVLGADWRERLSPPPSP